MICPVLPKAETVLALATVPEHSLPFMEAMSGGTAHVENGYLFFTGDDWLMAVAYPLTGEYDDTAFDAALRAVLRDIPARQAGRAVDCWAIGPRLPERLRPHLTDEDQFYTLPAHAAPPTRLNRPLARAAALLRVEEGRTFTPAHRRLWGEFMARTPLKANVRGLYAGTEAVLRGMAGGPPSGKLDLRLLNAWDAEGNLAACLLLDYSPAAFTAYLIGAHSREHPTPYASDLLFAHMLANARAAGKTYVHLGLGVNDGIRRFKTKWGARPALPYVMASWTEAASAGRETADAFFRLLLEAPPDLTKRKLLASLPEQRPFAMLWELEKNGRRSWIGGSAHFFCYSFEHSFRRLFEQVDTVLFEGALDADTLNDVDRIGKQLAPGAVCGPGTSLNGLLREEEIRRLERVVRGPQGRLARLLNCAWPNPADVRFFLGETRHWCALFSLWTAFLERQGWRESVDLEAWRIAHDMGLTVLGMESLEEQIASLEAVPVPRVLAFFQGCPGWKATIRRNVAAYIAGDLERMLGTSAEFPTRTEQIISHRDQRFRERMRPFLEKGDCAVFVGAAHMINLRHMLREDGFTLRQVRPTWKHRLRAALKTERP